MVGALLYKVLGRDFFKQALDVPLILCWAAEDGKKNFSVQTDLDPKDHPLETDSFSIFHPWEAGAFHAMGVCSDAEWNLTDKCWNLVEQLILCSKSP